MRTPKKNDASGFASGWDIIQLIYFKFIYSHTYNKQYVHFIKSDVTEEIL